MLTIQEILEDLRAVMLDDTTEQVGETEKVAVFSLKLHTIFSPFITACPT